MSSNPYRGLPSYCFWKEALVVVPPFALDPVVRSPIKLGKTQRVATAGSCFAQHISRALQKHGFNFLVTEKAPEGMAAGDAAARNYGVFSARYGNVYTTRQLRQLVARAYGFFSPEVSEWRRVDGRVVDPFRPQIEPDGFASQDDMLAAREAHLAQVRALCEGLDVLVFTLGLTEGWVHKPSGAVVPLAPGVAGGAFDEETYAFVNFGVAEVVEDLCAAIDMIREVNAGARFILTVSPVPLIATYRDQHVLVSNTYSKAALRVAAEEVSVARDGVFYFPSYEIITSLATAPNYYLDDLRSVSPLGVEHVMRVFFAHCVEGSEESGHPTNPDFSVSDEVSKVGRVVCDEEAIVRG